MYQRIITVKIPCGPPGGEDDYDVEVLLHCDFDEGAFCAHPANHRNPAFGKLTPWVPFILGTLDGDGYIFSRAEDWIDDHWEELREAARNFLCKDGAK